MYRGVLCSAVRTLERCIVNPGESMHYASVRLWCLKASSFIFVRTEWNFFFFFQCYGACVTFSSSAVNFSGRVLQSNEMYCVRCCEFLC